MKNLKCQICGKEVKMSAEDYQRWKEENVSTTDRDRTKGFECVECQDWDHTV